MGNSVFYEGLISKYKGFKLKTLFLFFTPK